MSTTADGRWHPAIGDPSLVGWVTVAAYFVAALLAGRAVLRNRARAAAGEPDAPQLARFWLAITWLLCALGVNKQLDLQTLFTQLARDLALAQGWYEERRRYQLAFIAGIGLVGAAGTAWLAYSLRRVVRRVWLGVLGVGLLLSFVLIRAASFHHVDLLLKRGALRLNWVLELSSIAVLCAGALREGSARRDDSRRAPAE